MYTEYNVGIYCRLSKEDLKGGRRDVSLSIENQQAIIEKFIAENGWNVHKVYIDDDVTGTTFDRPGFLAMLQDIKDAKINCVITKDLSRFGRNYVEAGKYREVFSDYNVRYIAIHYGHDSFLDDNNISTPIKEIMNEYYAADISKKVRNTKKIMATQGKFSNSRAPYGYAKSTENKHQLVVDEDVSHNVIRIFNMYLKGKTARGIADTYNNEGIPTINKYYYDKINKPNPNKNSKNKWNGQSIISIIRNPAYYGAISNGKREVKSFKIKVVITKDISDWVIVEDMHQPLITKEVWLEAQEISKRNDKETIRRNSKGDVTIFAGIIKCAHCGGNLVYNRKTLKSGVKEFFRCSNYTQKGKSVCDVNNIDYDLIYETVLKDIKAYAVLAEKDERILIDKIIKANNSSKFKDVKRIKKSIDEANNRATAIDKLLQNLYEDKVSGEITPELFNQMATKYSLEQSELNSNVITYEKQLLEFEKNDENLSGWAQKIKECVQIKTLTRSIVFELVDRIEVSETVDSNSKKSLHISISYKFQCPQERKIA